MGFAHVFICVKKKFKENSLLIHFLPCFWWISLFTKKYLKKQHQFPSIFLFRYFVLIQILPSLRKCIQSFLINNHHNNNFKYNTLKIISPSFFIPFFQYGIEIFPLWLYQLLILSRQYRNAIWQWLLFHPSCIDRRHTEVSALKELKYVCEAS